MTIALSLAVASLAWLAYHALRILDAHATNLAITEARLEALIVRLHGKCVMVDVGQGRYALLELNLLDEDPIIAKWTVSRN